MALFQIVTTSDWDTLMWCVKLPPISALFSFCDSRDRSAVYGHDFKLWISLYFLSFYILAVIIMCNLLIALIVVSAVQMHFRTKDARTTLVFSLVFFEFTAWFAGVLRGVFVSESGTVFPECRLRREPGTSR
jgi:hypothetical protein